MADETPRPVPVNEDRRWTVIAGLAVAGALAFSALFGLVIIPLAQAPGAGIDPWTAICRAVGVRPGTPAQPQPTFNATAQPVSLVEWTPHTLAVLASANPAPGAELADSLCSNCHGDQGFSMTDQFPRLAGQSPEAIYKQLYDFRYGARVNPQMTPIAQTLSSEQLAQVASYYGHIRQGPVLGQFPFPPGEEATDRLINRGDPHRRLPPCEGCHARDVGGPPEAPVIDGQNAAYLERQLMAFRTGERRNDVYRRMRDIAARLTPQEITEISEHYQGVF
jgi:cytochrome c553